MDFSEKALPLAAFPGWLESLINKHLFNELSDIQLHLDSVCDSIVIIKEIASSMKSLISAGSSNYIVKLQRVMDALELIFPDADFPMLSTCYLNAFGLHKRSESLSSAGCWKFPDTDCISSFVRIIRLRVSLLDDAILSKGLLNAKQKSISSIIASIRGAILTANNSLDSMDSCLARHLNITNLLYRIKVLSILPISRIIQQISALEKLESSREEAAQLKLMYEGSELSYHASRSNDLLIRVAAGKGEAEIIEKMIEDILRPLKVATRKIAGLLINYQPTNDTNRGAQYLQTVFSVLDCSNAELLTRFLNKSTMETFISSIQGIKASVRSNSKPKKLEKYLDVLTNEDIENIENFDIEMLAAYVQDWKQRASVIATLTSNSDFDKKYKSLHQSRQEFLKYQSLYDKTVERQSMAAQQFSELNANLKILELDLREMCLAEFGEDVNVIMPNIEHLRPAAMI